MAEKLAPRQSRVYGKHQRRRYRSSSAPNFELSELRQVPPAIRNKSSGPVFYRVSDSSMMGSK